MLGPQNTLRGRVLWMPSLAWWAGCTPYQRLPFQGVWGWWLWSKRLIISATWVTCSVLVVAVWLLPLLDASVPGVSFEKTFLFSRPSLCLSRGHLFSSNVRSSMLHGTETWPMTSTALHRQGRNDHAMIRWICGSSRQMTHQWTISMLN